MSRPVSSETVSGPCPQTGPCPECVRIDCIESSVDTVFGRPPNMRPVAGRRSALQRFRSISPSFRPSCMASRGHRPDTDRGSACSVRPVSVARPSNECGALCEPGVCLAGYMIQYRDRVGQ